MDFTEKNLDYWNEEWKKDYDEFRHAYLVPAKAVWGLRNEFIDIKEEFEEFKEYIDDCFGSVGNVKKKEEVKEEIDELQKENAKLKKRIEGITDFIQGRIDWSGADEGKFWAIANPPETSDEEEDVD